MQSQKHQCKSNIDTVLFDMDGLLIDSESISQKTFNDTIAAFGLPDQHDLFMDLIGRNAASLEATIMSSLGDIIDVSAFKKSWSDRYLAIVKNEPIDLKPGAVELLSGLKLLGIKTAVATSTKTSLARIKLTNAGIQDYFQVVIGGDQVTHSKPNPEIYLKAASAVTADIHKTWVLEDSAYGVQAGVAANFHVIQVPDLLPPTPALLSLGHRVCADLHEVLSLFVSNNEQSTQ